MATQQTQVLGRSLLTPAVVLLSTYDEGELDYEKVESGRRIFTGEIQTIPVPQREQLSLVELNEFAARDSRTRGHAISLGS